MSGYISRLNPAERRLVVVVGLVLFFIVNLVWVWPHFSDWGNLSRERDSALQKFANYQATIDQARRLEPEMRKLRVEGGDVPPDDQSLDFLRTVQTQAAQCGVGFLRNSSPRTGGNQFFVDQSQTISVQGGEKQMVDFLYNLGVGRSMIRVRSLSVRPDPAHQQLNADITLVASYQRKKIPLPAEKPAVAAPAAAAPVRPKAGITATNRPGLPAPPDMKAITPKKK